MCIVISVHLSYISFDHVMTLLMNCWPRAGPGSCEVLSVGTGGGQRSSNNEGFVAVSRIHRLQQEPIQHKRIPPHPRQADRGQRQRQRDV